jgi:ubiquinone/menaquinone biosynthesis C-methylase UbiE
MLYTSHSCAASLIIANKKVLDVACGNGTLSFMIRKKTSASVTGIDLDPVKINTAEKFAIKRGIKGTRFLQMDATDLSSFSEKEFEVGVISMAIHQFSPNQGIKVLSEMKRVCSKIIIVDYTWPMKPGFYKWLTQIIEWIAGGDHYRNFKQYIKNEGIDILLKKVGLSLKDQYLRGKSTIKISLCE